MAEFPAPGQPNDSGLVDPTGAPARRTDQAGAYTELQNVQNITQAEQALSKLFSTLLEGGKTAKEVAKISDELAKKQKEILKISKIEKEVVRRYAPQYNQGFQGLARSLGRLTSSRSLKEAGAQIDQLGRSAFKVLLPVKGLIPAIAALATAPLKLHDSLATMDAATMRRQVATGSFRRKGPDTSEEARLRYIGAGAILRSLGLGKEERDKLIGSMMGVLPRDLSDKSVYRAGEAAAAVTGATGLGMEDSSGLIAESLRMGMSPFKIKENIDSVIEDFEKLPTAEGLKVMSDLWKTTKLYGDSQKRAKEAVLAFETELLSGQYTKGTLEGIRGMQMDSSFGSMAKLMGLMRGSGMGEVLGEGNLFQQMDKLRTMPEKELHDTMLSLADKLTERLGGKGTISGRALVTENLVDMLPPDVARRFKVGGLIGKDLPTEKDYMSDQLSAAFEDLRKEASKRDSYSSTLVGHASKGVGYLADIFHFLAVTSRDEKYRRGRLQEMGYIGDSVRDQE